MESEIFKFSQSNAVAHTLIRVLNTFGQSADHSWSGQYDRTGVGSIDQKKTDDTISVLTRLWHAAVQATNDDALGITVADHIMPVDMEAVWRCSSPSSTMLEFYEHVVRKFKLVPVFGKLETNIRGSQIAVMLALPPSNAAPLNEMTDAGIGVLISLARHALGEQFNAKKIKLRRPKPLHSDRFDEFFGCPIEFNADENAAIFSYASLTSPLPPHTLPPQCDNANTERRGVHTEHDLDAHIDEMHRIVGIDKNKLRANDDDFVDLMISYILDDLVSGIPNQQKIARRMFKSVRSLRRKLAALDLTYKYVLEQTQCRLAVHYLSHTSYSIAHISSLLGYSEPSNFTRSFKKWTTQTPQRFRKNLSTIEQYEEPERTGFEH